MTRGPCGMPTCGMTMGGHNAMAPWPHLSPAQLSDACRKIKHQLEELAVDKGCT